MKALYIYPHPDDESFGPASIMAKQRREGHEIFLLTLTKGGATKQRFKYNYSIEEMGDVRYREMKEVAKVLDLNDMTVLDFPDSGLKDMNPIELENIITNHIQKIQPDVVVSYNVDGISGFQDHLVTHAVVKRTFCALKAKGSEYPKRFAMYTLRDTGDMGGDFHLKTSGDKEIDCKIIPGEEDKQKAIGALKCYKTYLEVIEKTKVMDHAGQPEYFEFFQENYEPYATDVFQDLK